MAEFEWDPAKAESNVKERNLDFTIASRIWEGFVFEQIDDRRDYGEVRLRALGEVDGRLMVVVFTWRGTVRRIISARKANPHERRRFDAEIRSRRKEAED
jgi:uncharacterized DUF497 family protein